MAGYREQIAFSGDEHKLRLISSRRRRRRRRRRRINIVSFLCSGMVVIRVLNQASVLSLRSEKTRSSSCPIDLYESDDDGCLVFVCVRTENRFKYTYARVCVLKILKLQNAHKYINVIYFFFSTPFARTM